MTIEQTVDIPASLASGGKRWLDLHLDIPAEFPAGRAIITFTPAAVCGSVRDITPEETRLLAKQVIEEHRPAFVELAK